MKKMIKNISIIYPIYNEAKKLNNIFKDIKKFNKKTKYIIKEYIFVDDGSVDQSKIFLKNFIKDYSNKKNKFKIISYRRNRGKGFALKTGIKSSTKKWILTSDSDCSVSNFQLIKWLNKKYINNEYKIYFGSRNHPDSIVKKVKIRQFIGYLFRLIILIFFNIRINDTQCGFKLYQSKIGKEIFQKVKTDGYMHDLEIVISANKMGIPIKELPVNWIHKNDGKINFLKDAIRIIFSLCKIKFSKY